MCSTSVVSTCEKCFLRFIEIDRSHGKWRIRVIIDFPAKSQVQQGVMTVVYVNLFSTSILLLWSKKSSEDNLWKSNMFGLVCNSSRFGSCKFFISMFPKFGDNLFFLSCSEEETEKSHRQTRKAPRQTKSNIV